MKNNFPKLAMASFSQQISEQFKNQSLITMHATNPQPFSQKELEDTIGQSFSEIVQDVNLGFAADAGALALRQTLADYHYETVTADDVIAYAGAQEALFCVFNALLQTGDKVLSVAPVFEPLLQIPLNIGCDVSLIYLNKNDNWSLNLCDVEVKFKQGCRLFIMNFPHNPTGTTIRQDELNIIVDLCKKYDVWLLSDEVFRGLEHSPEYKLPAVADLYDKGISIGVISKAFAIPGIRVGWLVCKNKQLRRRVLDIKGYLSVCNSQIDELLASVILKQRQKLLDRNLEIILNNKYLLSKVQSILGFDVDIIIPNTGCCLFAIIKEIGDLVTQNIGSNQLVKKIVKQTNYLLYPSSLFKTELNAVRIGFGNSEFVKFIKKIED